MPFRVTRLRVYIADAPVLILVRLLRSEHEQWVREDDLRYLPTPNEVENVACGFCADLDGRTCVDCEGYKHMAAERTDEDRAYDAAARARSVENDPVNHPSHYNRGKIEVIDCIAEIERAHV